MRAMPALTAVVLLTIVAVSGCRSGGGSGWSWNRKKADAALAQNADPALPSAAVAPTVDYASSGYSSATAPQGNTASAFAAPAGGPAEAVPYGGATNGYASSPAATATPYGAPPTADPTATPQQGSYADAYGQPPAAAPPAAYPNTGAPNAYPTPQTAANPYGAGDASPYGTTPPDAYGTPATANPYGAPQAPPAASTASTAPGADPYGAPAPYGAAAQPEQSAAAHYGAQQMNDPYGAPAPPVAAGAAAAGATATASVPTAEPYQAGATPYNPGQTNYEPGNTGYNPPGTTPYQMPGEPNVVATRNVPRFRPGGTSDYIPATRTPTAVADRYSNPAAAYSQGNSYMNQDGSNSPARGYTQ